MGEFHHFECRHCSTTLHVPVEALGKKIRCPNCRQIVSYDAELELSTSRAAAPGERESQSGGSKARRSKVIEETKDFAADLTTEDTIESDLPLVPKLNATLPVERETRPIERSTTAAGPIVVGIAISALILIVAIVVYLLK
jgi:hypothetical protein